MFKKLNNLLFLLVGMCLFFIILPHGQALAASNTPPKAGFTISPTGSAVTDQVPISFPSTATDPNGETLSYKYYYQASGSSTWTRFSTSSKPSKQFSMGPYVIKQVVTDSSGLSNSSTHNLYVYGAVKSGFSISPTGRSVTDAVPISFPSTATDPDGKILSYKYYYQKSGSSTWTEFSSSSNPSSQLSSGQYVIKQVVTNSDGVSSSSTHNLYVYGVVPKSGFKISPTDSAVIDSIKISFPSIATDPNGSSLSYKYYYQKSGSSTWTEFSTSSTPGEQLPMGDYVIKQVVTNSDGFSDSATHNLHVFKSNPPISGFKISPIGSSVTDDVKISFPSIATDPNGGNLSYKYYYQKFGSPTWTEFSTSSNPGKQLPMGQYVIKQVVTNSAGLSSSSTHNLHVFGAVKLALI